MLITSHFTIESFNIGAFNRPTYPINQDDAVFRVSVCPSHVKSVDELANAGIKMAEITKLKEARIVTVGGVLATPTKVREII